MVPDEQFEDSKLRLDAELKRADQTLAQKQFELAEAQFEWQKSQAANSGWRILLSPTGVVIVGAALGLLGTAAGKWGDYLTTKRQQETAVILKASEVPTSLSPEAQDEQRARNLLWFAQAGYVDLPNEFLAQLKAAANLKPGQTVPPPIFPSQLTSAGAGLIKKFEGFSPYVKKDGTSQLIGFDHRLTDAEISSGQIKAGSESIPFTNGITEEQAQRILEADLAPCYATIQNLVKVPLTPAQRDALASLCFNIGPRGFARSELLLKHLNEGNYEAVPEDIKRWSVAGGKPIPGLMHRREAEADLWKSPAGGSP